MQTKMLKKLEGRIPELLSRAKSIAVATKGEKKWPSITKGKKKDAHTSEMRTSSFLVKNTIQQTKQRTYRKAASVMKKRAR
jgi:hypothetical protein